MISVSVNNAAPVECPVCWEEATVKHYQDVMGMEVPPDDRKALVALFCAISGLKFDDVMDADGEVETVMYQVTAFVFNQKRSFEDLKPGDVPRIRIAGRTVDIPKDLGRLSVAQNMLMRQQMVKRKRLQCCISYALAVYLQPKIDGGIFEPQRVDELEKEVLKMPIYLAYPVGFFLLRRLMRSGPGGLRYWLRVQIARLSSSLRLRLKRASTALTNCMTYRSSTGTPKHTVSRHALRSWSRSTRLYLSSSSGRSRMSLQTV